VIWNAERLFPLEITLTAPLSRSTGGASQSLSDDASRIIKVGNHRQPNRLFVCLKWILEKVTDHAS
jgi:hypothetical protein